MQDSNGINSLRQARELLEKHALKGEHLAYINDEEAKYLRYMGGAGIPVNASGIPSYWNPVSAVKSVVKTVTKPIAKVLDKIVPNEIKPALPFVAAAVPFMLGPTFSFGGLSSELSRALAAAGANAVSQLSQEGAAERGINPISLGLSGLSGYLSTPGVSDTLSAGKIVGNVPGGEAITAGELAKYTGVGGYENIAPPTFLQSTENIARNIGSYGAENLSKGTEAFQKLTGPETFTGTDALDLAKAYVPGGLTASGENALVYADLAKKRYEQEMNAMGQLASSNKQQQIDYIRRAMVSAGFNEDEIGSALTRSGFNQGGYAGYAKGGIMNLGGMEMDYRAKGGFVPIGKKERADDVPARLSKNEFVFTAKAVRNAGGGDIRKGAKKMYQIMNQLEAMA